MPTVSRRVKAEGRPSNPDLKTLLRIGRGNWEKLGDSAKGKAKQLELVDRLIVCRKPELKIAYKNTVQILSGFGTKKGRKYRELKSPCVVFVVKRKRIEPKAKKNSDAKFQRIPHELLIFGGDAQIPYSVPTDVVDGQTLFKAIPHARSITVGPDFGVGTCAVRTNELIYALSCRHVLALTEIQHPTIPVGADVFVKNGPRIGAVTSFMGVLTDAPRTFSHDAGFTQVQTAAGMDALKTALHGVVFNGFAGSSAEIPLIDECIFVGADGYRRRVHYARVNNPGEPDWSDGGWPIDYPKVGKVWHPFLVYWLFLGSFCALGDSGGSYQTSDGKLLGMHIAGTGDEGVMLPAWYLFRSSLYAGLNGSPISLINDIATEQSQI